VPEHLSQYPQFSLPQPVQGPHVPAVAEQVCGKVVVVVEVVVVEVVVVEVVVVVTQLGSYWQA